MAINNPCKCGCGQIVPSFKRPESEFVDKEHRIAHHKNIREAGKRALGITLPEIAAQQGTPGFFNTVNLKGEELSAANKRAGLQEAEILAFFQENKGLYTPCEVARIFPQWPITSIRRGITNLTTRGELVKTQVKRKGAYGMETHCWCAV